MAHVTVRLFAALRELAGSARVEADGETVGDLVGALSERFGERFGTVVAAASVVVDGERADVERPRRIAAAACDARCDVRAQRARAIDVIDARRDAEQRAAAVEPRRPSARRAFDVPGELATRLRTAERGDSDLGTAVRGPTGCRYLNDERQRRYVENGWNVTGDTYIMDEDGYFWYQARSDDMIISSGYNIAGPEVEAALLTHEAVAECGVVGVPHSERGMIVKAYVVLQAGHSPGGDLAKAMQEHVKAEIAPYKYPRVIDFVDALPRTPTGKLQRFELRRIALEQIAAASAAAAE